MEIDIAKDFNKKKRQMNNSRTQKNRTQFNHYK